jgi:hypothetical protein
LKWAIPFLLLIPVIADAANTKTIISRSVDSSGGYFTFSLSTSTTVTLIISSSATERALIRLSIFNSPFFEDYLERNPEMIDLKLPRLRLQSSSVLKKRVMIMIDSPTAARWIKTHELRAIKFGPDEFENYRDNAIGAELCNRGTAVCLTILPYAFDPYESNETVQKIDLLFVAAPNE